MNVLNLLLFVGAACVIGFVGWSIRSRLNRKHSRPVEVVDPDLDQTCELNYRPE